MEKISLSINGGSMLISGTLILNLVMAGMSWERIEKYGLFHELGLRGIAPIIFMIGIIFMIVGCICIVKSSFKEEPVEDIEKD